MTKTLTASNIRYLLIMQRLDPENKGTRCTDVAEKLKCSKPSVHNMMHTLRDMGIIRRDAYGESFFTEEGLALAERYSRYFDAVASLLADRFPEDDLLSGVCAFLSEMPEAGAGFPGKEGRLNGRAFQFSGGPGHRYPVRPDSPWC